MPANWDPIQTLNGGRVEWPTGPMTLSPGFSPRWVEAWVVQGGLMGPGDTWTGPSQSTGQSSPWSGWGPGSTQWTADAPGWINGNGSFQAGAAIGISVLASRNAGTYEYHWWFEVVALV
jgi:hypothetical protein